MRLRIPLIWMCLICLLVGPAPARAALFGEFGLADEMKVGREFEALVKSSMPLVEDPEIKLYVQSVVDRIVAKLPPQPYSFQTNVMLHSSLNAFAVPGGFVFVHTGLIQNLKHESELAGVLSHEIAHVTQRHIAHRIERGTAISLASIAGMLLGAFAGGSVGQAAIAASAAAGPAAMLSYSRADEDDADQFGIRYLVDAGYNPLGLSGAFSRIQELSYGRGADYPEYLSTHPDLTARLTTMAARVQSMSAELRNRQEDDSRFRRVQALVWAKFGDIQHAAQVFAARDPKDPLTHMGLGILAARQNRVKDAEASFKRALELAPRDSLVLREAGIFHYNMSDIRMARAQLEQCLNINPDDAMGQFFYARLLDDEGDSQGAQAAYRKVLSYVPEDAEVHTYYGRSLGKSRQEFLGYLHLAYAAVYSNDQRRAKSWLDKAQSAARNAGDQAELKKFTEVYTSRQKLWSQR